MKTVAYIGRDFFSAKNLFIGMKTLALKRGLEVTSAAEPFPTLTVGKDENRTAYSYFYRGNVEQMRGAAFDGVWITTALTPEQDAVARATLVESKGLWIEGKPSLD